MWHVDNDEVEFLKDSNSDLIELGSRAFGAVNLCRYRGIEIAVKKSKCDKENEERFNEECDLLYKMSHPNIIRVMGASFFRKDGGYFSYILMELVTQGNLRTALDQNLLDEGTIDKIIIQVLIFVNNNTLLFLSASLYVFIFRRLQMR